MYKNIFFDFDGTLFDTGEGILKSVQYSALEFGFDEPDISKLRSFVGPPLQDSFMRRFGVDEKTAEKMISKFRERYSTIGVFECKPYPEIFELILELKNLGYGLSIATGKPTVFALEILERYGFKDLFSEVLGSGFDGSFTKKSDVIFELMKRLGSNNVVMIGDRDNDVWAASECGIPCIGVEWGYAESGELVQAGAISVVDSVSELKQNLIA